MEQPGWQVYCLNMAWAALELSMGDPAYEDLATKFLEHFLASAGR